MPSPWEVPIDLFGFHPSIKGTLNFEETRVYLIKTEIIFTSRKKFAPPTDALRPIRTSNARPFRVTAAAGTNLAGTLRVFLPGSKDRNRHFPPDGVFF